MVQMLYICRPPVFGKKSAAGFAGIGNGNKQDVLNDLKPHPPSQPREAWRNAIPPVSPLGLMEQREHFPSGKPPLPPVTPSDTSEARIPHTQRTATKSEKLTEEW